VRKNQLQKPLAWFGFGRLNPADTVPQKAWRLLNRRSLRQPEQLPYI
jgi:hypothetical protein